MKEDCSNYDLLFVCLCPQHTSERGCIGPLNIAVRHQSSGASRIIPKGSDMARARDMLLGAKHRRKRPLQRWQVTCLGRDSNERPNRPLRVLWGFRHRCPIS
ncbi:hypothetical protein AVEN_92249-1 [Araneus ventricosus]|uniref:Uncharacterized protein n=1 Tax=Araneus ventricosus TaxID=182803 RepID=A0A4Y2AKQ6_ARAVE|nr:hypothetical protein AVEN_92249-1 [Araneus ventricosus]